jgi:UDP-glucose 4-epimerase
MTGDRPLILVTGASGFIGRHVAPVLARGGWAVRHAMRQPTGYDDEVVIESLSGTTEWTSALSGVDAVLHLAARVHRRNDGRAFDLYRDINVDGTLHLARCAAEAGVRKFIFVSTILVHGRSNDGRAPFSERDILTPRGSYGTSKAAAEAGLRELSRESGMQVTVIRPPLVYGAWAKGNFAFLARAVRRRIPLPFAAIRNQRAFLSVENLASFILHRLTQADKGFEVFLVADQEQVSTPEFVERMARAADIKPRMFPLPTPVLTALLTMAGQPEAYESLIGSLKLDLSKAASIGWRPPITMDEGLRRALAETENP